MELVGVQEMKIRKHGGDRKIKKTSKKKGIKVVYISSPMKVETCASKFRDLVQELTGKNSDADASALRFSNVHDDSQDSPKVVDHHHHHHQDTCVVSSSGVAAIDDQFDDVDDLFMPHHREGSFLGMFKSNLFHHDFNFQHDYELQSFDSV